ncbi:MAG: hypothetical protein N3F63_05920 [Thermoplasmata archaeon]|nr:hypothetical protein [Thermoplasmata archaeon]
MKIGILTYDDEWAQELVHRLSLLLEGVEAKVIGISEVSLFQPLEYRIILDRQSYLEPYLRCAMKHAALHGTYVINNPFSCSLDDKFFFYGIAEKLGMKVPKTLMLPPFDPDYEFGHVVPPVSWEWVRNEVQFPAVLKPVNGYAWRNVFFVNTLEELCEVYRKTGNETMILQEKVEYTEYVRAFVVGKKHVLPVKYVPGERKYVYTDEFLSAEMREKIAEICVKLNTVLDYDINTVEVGIADGIPYLIDFSNYVPEIKTYNLPKEYYRWIVEKIAEMIAEYAKTMPRNRNMFLL